VSVQGRAALDEVAAEWEALAERTGAAPFSYPGWLGIWNRAFAEGAPEVLTVRDGRRLVGVLPVLRSGRTLRSPTNDHSHHFGLLAEDEQAAAELAAALFSDGPEGVALDHLDATTSDLPTVRGAAEAAGQLVVSRPLAYNLLVRLDRDAALPARLTRDVERRRRRLEEHGAVSLEVDESAGRLEEGLRLEGSGWKEAKRTAILSQPATASFYRKLAAWAEENGWLRVNFLCLDARPIAFQLALEQGGAHYFLKGGYDPDYHAHSPGKLLLHALLGRARERGLARFELLGDVEPWKLEWADTVRVRLSVRTFVRSARGLTGYAAQAYLRPLLRRDRRLALLRA
jgi:CelD/BcsL family acetyltransferase involved in cellulose biosynthesis